MRVLCGPAWRSHRCPASPTPSLSRGQIVGSPLHCEDTSLEGDGEGIWDTAQTPAAGHIVPTVTKVTKPFGKG